MKMQARNLLWQLPLLFLLTYPLWRQPVEGFLRPRTTPIQTEVEIASSGAERSGKMEEVIVQQGGKSQQWIFFAQQLQSVDMGKDIWMERVRAEIVDPSSAEGQGKATRVTGDNGRYFSNKKRFTISDNVEMVTSSGYILKSTALHFFDLKEVLIAENAVEFSGENFLIKGRRLKYDLASGDIVVEGSVQYRLW